MIELPEKQPLQPDSWTQLRAHTSARIALGRAGVSIPTREVLAFKMDHAHARDAIYSTLDVEALRARLEQMGLSVTSVETQAKTREVYIQRPDLGRRLSPQDAANTADISARGELVLVIADGLSAEAVNRHAPPLLAQLLPLLRSADVTVQRAVLARQGRVALGDDVGGILQAETGLVLIGERPGLTSPDSLGAYLTFGPRVGLTDESRNCVSNIRPEGLPYEIAARKLFYLITEARRLKLSGVHLKDNVALKE